MIRKSALILDDGNGRILMARSVNQPQYGFPGGKIEAGESVEDALVREIREELAAEVYDVTEIGEATGATADGRELVIYMFGGRTRTAPVASSEIEELAWISADDIERHPEMHTPITRTVCLDMLKAAKIL